MIRSASLLLALVISSLGLNATQSGQENSSSENTAKTVYWLPYATSNFSLEYPALWIVRPSQWNEFIASDPDDKDAAITVTFISSSDTPAAIASCAAEDRALLEFYHSHFEDVSNIYPPVAAGQAVIHRWEIMDGTFHGRSTMVEIQTPNREQPRYPNKRLIAVNISPRSNGYYVFTVENIGHSDIGWVRAGLVQSLKMEGTELPWKHCGWTK